MTAAAAALLLLLCGCGAKAPDPLCVLDVKAMPESWRPHVEVHKGLSAAPWTAEESNDALHALQRGWDELIAFFAKFPEAVRALGSDAVEAFVDLSYSASNMPRLKTAAREEARKALAQLTAPILARTSDAATCSEFEILLAYTNYAHILQETGHDNGGPRLVALTNAAYRACDSLEAAMGQDYRKTLSIPGASRDHLWSLVMWSISFTDGQLVPGLELPALARELPSLLWKYVENSKLVGAAAYPDRGSNSEFYDTAYLATHVAYIVTGYGRHPIYVADSPSLYQFLRENFYAVLELGELDLLGEFADLFRQYGCTEQNDMQLRDATRYLLKLFHAAGGSWLTHREKWQGDAVSFYDALHKPWTGMAGLRVRVPEPPVPGTYGGVVRQWLGHPR